MSTRTDIDALLARAKIRNPPYTAAHIAAAEERLILRLSTPHPPPAEPAPATPADPEASRALQTLSEAVVTAMAVTYLHTFLAPAMPDPDGARVLGCALQLAARPDDARHWWQYAAGAGDTASLYCLYLHHQVYGETARADHWLKQLHDQQPAAPAAGDAAHRTYDVVPVLAYILKSSRDASLWTMLRILAALKRTTGRPRMPAEVGTLVGYVPLAIAHVDMDLDLPLPVPEFVPYIRTLTGRGPHPASGRRTARDRLPERTPRTVLTEHGPGPETVLYLDLRPDLRTKRRPERTPCGERTPR